MTARIVSDGTAPAALTLHLFLGRASAVSAGANALATGQVSYGHLVPGSVTRLSSPLGKDLRKGAYDVFATWTDPTGAQHTLEAEFITTAAQSFLQGVWSAIKNLLILWVVLLLLGLLAVIAALGRRLTEHQRQIEAELAAARERLQAAGLDAVAAPDEPLGPASTPGQADPGTADEAPIGQQRDRHRQAQWGRGHRRHCQDQRREAASVEWGRGQGERIAGEWREGIGPQAQGSEVGRRAGIRPQARHRQGKRREGQRRARQGKRSTNERPKGAGAEADSFETLGAQAERARGNPAGDHR